MIEVCPDLAGRAVLTSDWLDGYQWEPPYPGAGPETPDWQVTPASVGQGALTAFDPSHQESNVLANSYVFPDYARRPRRISLYQSPSKKMRMGPSNALWVGSPMKFLPPDGDYPGPPRARLVRLTLTSFGAQEVRLAFLLTGRCCGVSEPPLC
eukprot:265627-Hanusia_phi.AAC.3